MSSCCVDESSFLPQSHRSARADGRPIAAAKKVGHTRRNGMWETRKGHSQQEEKKKEGKQIWESWKAESRKAEKT